MKFFTTIKEDIINGSKYSCYIENDKTKFTLCISFSEKTESEEKLHFAIIKDHREDSELSNLLHNAYKNILAYKMEKLRVNVTVCIVEEGVCLLSTICNTLTVGLIKAGIAIKDMVSAVSNKSGTLVYSVHSNKICYLKHSGEDILNFTYEAINDCNSMCGEIESYITKTC